MSRIKVTGQSFEMSIEDVEEIFNRSIVTDAPPKPRGKQYTILRNLTPNRQSVINQCKAALVRQFGMAEAARYIRFKEDVDPRGYQFWLKYQIEHTPYPDDYCLLEAAQKWFNEETRGQLVPS